MKNCRSLIIEDSPEFRDILVEYIAKVPYMTTPLFAGNLSEAVCLLKQPFELIFLDIHLPDQTGITLLEAFPKRPPVIVTTSSPDFGADSYDFEVADYLLKPYTFSRFLRAVNRALGSNSLATATTTDDSIFLKVGHLVQRFYLSDIDFIQAYGIYSKVVCAGKLVVVNETMAALETMLPSNRFMRVHKSYIVNLHKFQAYSNRTIHIDQVEIPLGTAYRDKFRSYIGIDKEPEA